MRQDLLNEGFSIYPPFYKVLEYKQQCYPNEDIRVTETEASVSLQSLLEHTFNRIVQNIDESVSYYCEKERSFTIGVHFGSLMGFRWK